MKFSIKVSLLTGMISPHPPPHTLLQPYKSYQYLKVHLLDKWKSFKLPSLDSTRAYKLKLPRARGVNLFAASQFSDICIHCWAVETRQPESTYPAWGGRSQSAPPTAAIWECGPMGTRSSNVLREAKNLHFMWNIPIVNVGSIKKVKRTTTLWSALDPWNH